MPKVIKLLKTWAYSLCAACCATAFSVLGDGCLNPENKCGVNEYVTIAMTVITFVVCFLMLAMWLLNDVGAAGLSPIASNLILLTLLVGIGFSTRTLVGGLIPLGVIFVALVVALLLAVYSWNQLTNPPEPYAAAKPAEEPEAVAA